MGSRPQVASGECFVPHVWVGGRANDRCCVAVTATLDPTAAEAALQVPWESDPFGPFGPSVGGSRAWGSSEVGRSVSGSVQQATSPTFTPDRRRGIWTATFQPELQGHGVPVSGADRAPVGSHNGISGRQRAFHPSTFPRAEVQMDGGVDSIDH